MWLALTVVSLVGVYFALKRPIVGPEYLPSAGAHSDHRPRHGGVFFMASNGFHHLEGTLAGTEFRVYIYDNFTRPMDARQFEARVGKRLMEPGPNGDCLTVQLDELTTVPPEVTAFVRFTRDGREERFDFIFSRGSSLEMQTLLTLASNS